MVKHFYPNDILISEAASGGVLFGILRNSAKFIGKHLCQSLNFDKVAVLRPEETLARVFSCEFCKISNNTLFTEHVSVTTSQILKKPSKTQRRLERNLSITGFNVNFSILSQ